ncbi:MAG: DoxX family protein [Deltaproteobacteria bacterium]|nr:DoxX family protein [Deltaproteobacteria bacterium]
MCSSCTGDGTLHLIQLLVAAFLGILFLQSGLDKVVDSQGNLEYLESHFEKSPLKPLVPRMFALITVVEVLAGAASALGALWAVFGGTRLAWVGALLANVAIVSLFFGQRVAKDYAGAAALVPYFILTLGALWVLHL